MKILFWNCKGNLRTKIQLLKSINADLFVIAECENPETTASEEYKKWANNSIWTGLIPYKGLAIIANPQIKLGTCNWPDYLFRNYLPIKINGNTTLLAIWARNPYIEDINKYLSVYWNYINDNTIIIGDFNSNIIWDKKHDFRNHSYLNQKLSEKGLFSIYHTLHQTIFGKEKQPTFFMHHNPNKPYHIDYCYCSKSIMKSCQILDAEKWHKASDHNPMIIELDLPY